MKASETYSIGFESGPDGRSRAWVFELPGCAALVEDVHSANVPISNAILEFLSWAHFRAPGRLEIDPGAIKVVESTRTAARVANGSSGAFFGWDGMPPSPREFPTWANAHDLAIDEFRVLVSSMPQHLAESLVIKRNGRKVVDLVAHLCDNDRRLTLALDPGHRVPNGELRTMKELQEAHRILQEVVCGAPAARITGTGSPDNNDDRWSVRKVMRRSIWHLRYHTAEVRDALSGIWLA